MVREVFVSFVNTKSLLIDNHMNMLSLRLQRFKDYIPDNSIYTELIYKDRKQISGCLGMGGSSERQEL